MALDIEQLVRAVKGMIEFLRAFGDSEQTRIVPLRQFMAQVKERDGTFDALTSFEKFKDELYLQVREQIFAGRTLAAKDQDQTMRELDRVFGAVFQTIHPLEPPQPQLDISTFAGGEHVKHKGAYVIGDARSAREIVERAIEFALRYSKTLGSGDLEAAYAMSDGGLREMMSFEQFVQTHQDAQRQFGGPALEFQIERFAFVLADQSARQQSKNFREGWPNRTAKNARRCRLIGFWVRDRDTQRGSRGSLWISEEVGEYRLANFNFYED